MSPQSLLVPGSGDAGEPADNREVRAEAPTPEADASVGDDDRKLAPRQD